MVSGMVSMGIEDEQVKGIVAKVTGIIPKLVPVVARIDFIKSKASSSTFDGLIWHTRGVTHYFSGKELAERRAAAAASEEPVAVEAEPTT